MDQQNAVYANIPQEKFRFVKSDGAIHDKKLETKARGYFADALIRFKKNKSSVIAAWILLLLAIFSFLSPLLSPYSIDQQDTYYNTFPPYIEAIAQKNLGFLDGGYNPTSGIDDNRKTRYEAIGIETGMNPLLKILSTTEQTRKDRGKLITEHFYTVRLNRYYELGVIGKTLHYDEYQDIQKFQDETGLQVIYPAVLQETVYGSKSKIPAGLKQDYNLWYQVGNQQGKPKLDAQGNLIPAYCTNPKLEGKVPYTSTRIAGDDGSYIYSLEKSNSVLCRICYYNYYQYLQWRASGGESFHEPRFLMGTNSMGQDIFCAIGIGARFSLIFAILVSSINLIIGAVYGAIQGYYGGVVDLAMDRVSDILSGVPMIVVVTLFQLHLAAKMGSVPAFLLSFVMTGWIGMAALTRKQFYRFKSQEFVYAAKTLGASDWRLMFKHVFPNSLGTIVTSCALVIPGVVSSETSLTYLGIINLSQFAGTSIGTLMQQGQLTMQTAPHAMIFPAIFFALLMICFNLFGNGLRDAFNPSTRGIED